MKLKLTILIIVTCFAGSAFAKIGDTEAKWLTRFPGTRLIARDTYKGHKRMAVQFPDGGHVVGVFVNNSCEFQTSLTPRTTSREPSSSDVEKVADQYGGHLDSWTFLSPNENHKQWVRPDRQLEIVVQKEQDGRWSVSTIAGPMLAEFTGSSSPNVAQNSAAAPDTTVKVPEEPTTEAQPIAFSTRFFITEDGYPVTNKHQDAAQVVSQQPETQPETTATPEATPQERSISWREVDAIYNLKSKKTNLQKDALWSRFKGKRVTWTGKVSHMSGGWFGGLSMQVKMNRDTWTSDLIIDLDSSQKDRAMQFEEGDTVRFAGILREWGTLMPITIGDGEILN